MSNNFSLFKKKLANQFAFRMFLLTKLPVAFFSGLKLAGIEPTYSSISVRYGWFNTNPFRSMYFAVLAMAGEVSTGILAMGYLYRRTPSVSMLLIKNEGEFFKKATGKIVFTCNDGEAINAAVEQAIATGEATSFACTATGKNESGEVVAKFIYTWSFKARNK